MTATDSDGDALMYSLSGSDAVSFTIDSSTGQIAVQSGAKLDYESKTSYSVMVGVSDNKDASGNFDRSVDDTVSVTINITDVNEPPSAPSAPTVSRNSGSPHSSLYASWSSPDVSGKPAVTDYDVRYKTAGETTWSSHDFSGSGTVTVLNGLDANTIYQVQVRAINDEGRSAWSSTGKGITAAESSSTPTATVTPTPAPIATPASVTTVEASPAATPSPTVTPTPTPTGEGARVWQQSSARRTSGSPTPTVTPAPTPTGQESETDGAVAAAPGSAPTPTPTPVPGESPASILASGFMPNIFGCDCIWQGILAGGLLGVLALLLGYVAKRRRANSG